MSSQRLLPKIAEDEAKGCMAGLKELRNRLNKFAVKIKAERHGVFAVKMGSALTLVSLLVFINRPHIEGIQNHALWAILTVVVVFEFTIGATLSKGSNRLFGTLSAGILALAAATIATRFHGNLETVFIIFCIFILGCLATVVKLHPAMEQYEYGSKVFLLTFCYLLVQGSRNGEFIDIAVNRFILIAMGGAVSVLVNICIWPIWAGQDLHRIIVKNFMNVADSIEGCMDQYLSVRNAGSASSTFKERENDPIYSGYRTVLSSVSKENSLRKFARWEPPHGRYKMLNYPWDDYLKVADSLRGCAYVAITVHSCILSEIQAPHELRQAFKHELTSVSHEAAEVLRQVGKSLESMTCLTNPEAILSPVLEAATNLQNKIDSRSMLLVNAHSWIIPPPKTVETPPMLPFSPPVYHKRAASVFVEETSNSVQTNLETLIDVAPAKPARRQRRRTWPWHNHDFAHTMFDEEAKESSLVLASARALSLATFASFLLEFVVRLDEVVRCFNDLSERACFASP